jgi:hypothetical protein
VNWKLASKAFAQDYRQVAKDVTSYLGTGIDGGDVSSMQR